MRWPQVTKVRVRKMAQPPTRGMGSRWTLRGPGLSRTPQRFPNQMAIGVQSEAQRRETRKRYAASSRIGSGHSTHSGRTTKNYTLAGERFNAGFHEALTNVQECGRTPFAMESSLEP